MAGFLKKLTKKKGEDTFASSEELLGETTQAITEANNEEIETALYFHPEHNVPAEERYFYQFLNNELSPLKPNQLSLAGIDLQEEDGYYTVSAFMRNSLTKSVQLKDITLLLLGVNNEVLARKVFDFTNQGEFPPESSTPCFFMFTKRDMIKEEVPKEGWKLAFEIKKEKKHRLELAETWETALPDTEKEKLETLLASLPNLEENELNLTPIQTKRLDNNDLHVTLLIRNGSNKNVELHQLPLVVEEASGDPVAKGVFKLEGFTVSANTSKPWSFIFPESLLLKEEFDTNQLKIYSPDQREIKI
jgi:accessory Sec system S-layer assembly protein